MAELTKLRSLFVCWWLPLLHLRPQSPSCIWDMDVQPLTVQVSQCQSKANLPDLTSLTSPQTCFTSRIPPHCSVTQTPDPSVTPGSIPQVTRSYWFLLFYMLSFLSNHFYWTKSIFIEVLIILPWDAHNHHLSQCLQKMSQDRNSLRCLFKRQIIGHSANLSQRLL